MSEPINNLSIDKNEIAKFEAMAEEWWDLQGKFKPLHVFNPVRVEYIRDLALSHFSKKREGFTPLSGLTILDIGCGGGLLSEPLCRLGARVTGIDPSEKNIAIARLHAEKTGLEINYRAVTVESLAQGKKQFDVVLAMEVVEHVADVPSFLQSCASLVKPGGMLIAATMNRTVKSFLYAIVGAEYVLRWLPKGTHDWQKFLKPSEVVLPLEDAGLALKKITGVTYNPLRQEWYLSRDVGVNYMVVAVR